MDFADAELIADFVIESREGLANIEQQMLAIEAAGANVEVDLVNAVFRTMHSIKGSAGFLGLDRIGALAHGLEESLNRMRNRELAPSCELVTVVLEAADYMKGLIEAVDTSNEADISTYVAKLQRFNTRAVAEAQPESVAIDPPAPVAATANPANPANHAASSEAAREFISECHENLDLMDRDLLALEQEPDSPGLTRGVFRVMHTVKGGAGFLGFKRLEQLAHAAENVLGKLRDGRLTPTADLVGVLLTTTDKCREGLRVVETNGSDLDLDIEPLVRQLLAFAEGDSATNSLRTPTSNHPAAGPAPAEVSRLAEPVAGSLANLDSSADKSGADKSTDRGDKGDKAERGAASTSESTIRVDVALLDKLMTRVGELVLARNQILQRAAGLNDAEFVSTAQRLNLITTELQESVMKTRMQPIGNVWAKFPRVVRDLSSQLGKQVRIEMEGKETELDKTIVEAIKDPLTHLVRNSVDHGIEAPAARRALGKNEEGVLSLRAYHEGGQVNIEITDDGAGLNIDRIRKKAVEKGLIGAESAARLSEREAAQLILLPGFSTAEQVTNVSGRGVGMDVVKTNIERIGGTLDLQSRPGEGTTVKIKIPLTLAIIPALIVTTGGDRYAIPQVSLLELVRLEGEQVRRSIEYVQGAPVYRLRGKLLPLVDLAERLGLKKATVGAANEGETAEDRSLNIVVLRANDRQYGLVVDKVNDTEEIVVKPLSRQLKGLSEYAGATIMGDGAVALILDVMGLAVASGLAGEIRESSHAAHSRDDSSGGPATQTLLVVDLGDARRFALPTSMVARLEKIAASSIEQADDRQVIQYRGQILPLAPLGAMFGVQPPATPPSELQIVVYAEQDRRCGFVVNRIVDIVETELNLQTSESRDGALLGAAVIQQRVTDVLNLPHLARCAIRGNRAN